MRTIARRRDPNLVICELELGLQLRDSFSGINHRAIKQIAVPKGEWNFANTLPLQEHATTT